MNLANLILYLEIAKSKPNFFSKNFLQLLFDWAIKRLLSDKASYGVLEGFLTSLLGREIKIHRLLERFIARRGAEKVLSLLLKLLLTS